MNNMKRPAYLKQCSARHLLIGFFGLMLVLNTAGQTKSTGGINDADGEGSVLKRDPFWPVGYTPKGLEKKADGDEGQAVKPATDSNWSLAMKKVVINGISSRSNNEFYAVINGAVKSVGDTVIVKYEGTTYTWSVDKIQPPGSVKLRRVSAR